MINCKNYWQRRRKVLKIGVAAVYGSDKNVGGAKGCLLSKITKVGGAIAPPAPPVPPPL